MKPRRLDFGSLKRRLPAFVVAIACVLFLGWVVVRFAAAGALARTNPVRASLVAPEDPRVISGLVQRDLRLRLANPEPDVENLVRRSVRMAADQALGRAPLMEEPFLLGGLDGLVKRDNRRAHRMLSQALARNPRSRLARLFMLEIELRTGDVDRAAVDMTILGRLIPDAQKAFVPELARLAQDPRTTIALRRVLRTDARMHGAVLQHLAAKGTNLSLILRIAHDRPILRADPDLPDWRGTLLDRLVKTGDLRRAHALWLGFSGVDAVEAKPGVYDGNFEGLPGYPPFNWTFVSSELGAAERDKTGGLNVQYYGRDFGELASQLLVLPPGRYRMTLYAEGDLNSPHRRLIWKVHCLRDKKNDLLALPLAEITYAGRRLAANFTVPPKCEAQWLKLVGEPTEFPKIENVLIRDLRIRPLATPA